LPSSSLSGVSSLILFPLFGTVVIDTGGNLPPASLTPVVHLDLRLFPKIFETIRNDPNVIIRGLGEVIHEKKPEAKNLVTLSL
jgi:hypothetical protein